MSASRRRPADGPPPCLSGPDLDFVAIARGFGVPASRATSADDFVKQLERALAEPGPALIEAMVPSIM